MLIFIIQACSLGIDEGDYYTELNLIEEELGIPARNYVESLFGPVFDDRLYIDNGRVKEIWNTMLDLAKI